MREELQAKIKTLNELMWDRRFTWRDIEEWLAGFTGAGGLEAAVEQNHALYLLSRFSYFDATVMRALLRAVFRDFIKQPIYLRLRRRHGSAATADQLKPALDRQLDGYRFLAMGNPSESGSHLLYYFRQENALRTPLFVNPHELFAGTIQQPKLTRGVRHVVFLDDFCGSGTQASRYSRHVLERLKHLSPKLRASYFPVFATSRGLAKVKRDTQFDDVQTVCELDDSFRSLERGSRYFREPQSAVDRERCRAVCNYYGGLLEPSGKLGFGKCQLLLGFAHNIPNNTLPIFWSKGGATLAWNPPFPRYTKGAGW